MHLHVRAQIFAPEPAHVRFGPDDRIAERMAREERLFEVVVNDVFGIILGVLQLFDHHEFFLLHLAPFECCIQHEVRKDIHGFAQVRIEHAGVVAGLLFGGKRIEVTAERLEALRDFTHVPVVRAFEDHMFEEVTYSVLGGFFVSGPDIGPDADRNGTDVRDRFAHYPYAIFQRGLTVVGILDLTLC